MECASPQRRRLNCKPARAQHCLTDGTAIDTGTATQAHVLPT